jgi:hypothetical protein
VSRGHQWFEGPSLGRLVFVVFQCPSRTDEFYTPIRRSVRDGNAVIDIADPHRQVAVGPISAGGVLIVANRALVFLQQAESQETTHAETRLGIVLAEV